MEQQFLNNSHNNTDIQMSLNQNTTSTTTNTMSNQDIQSPSGTYTTGGIKNYNFGEIKNRRAVLFDQEGYLNIFEGEDLLFVTPQLRARLPDGSRRCCAECYDTSGDHTYRPNVMNDGDSEYYPRHVLGVPYQCPNAAVRLRGENRLYCEEHQVPGTYHYNPHAIVDLVPSDVPLALQRLQRIRIPTDVAPDFYARSRGNINDINTFTTKVTHPDPEECGICGNEHTEMRRLSQCRHELCEGCLVGWLDSRQPMAATCVHCRTPFIPPEAFLSGYATPRPVWRNNRWQV